jgi:hypothetical protein
MSVLAHLALIGWMPAVLIIFSLMSSPRRAVIVSYLVAWCFLPFVTFDLPGLPDWGKFSATNISVMLAVLVYDPNRLWGLRPKAVDIPVIVFCITPGIASLTNGLGLFDACSAFVDAVITWGIPYLLGRAYFNDLEGLRELAIGLVLAGLLYIPFVLIESRMAPQMHRWIYGVHTRHTSERVGIFGPLGWKPSVFMDSALALTMFMGLTAICGVWLWTSKSVERIMNVPMGVVAFMVFCGALLGKAMGGVSLMFGALIAFFGLKVLRGPLPIICLLLVAPTYLAVRTTGIWTGADLISWIDENISARRAFSLETRLESEELLVPKAMERKWFGWGRWGRNLIWDEKGSTIIDGLWLILVGQTGLVGLISLYTVLLLPPARLLLKQPAAFWLHPASAGAVALTVGLLIYSIDCLLNAMINPILTVVAGGLMCLPTMRIPHRQARPVVRAGQPSALHPPMPAGGAPRIGRSYPKQVAPGDDS